MLLSSGILLSFPRFLMQLEIFWMFICCKILGCILDILIIILWDSGCWFKSYRDVNIFYFSRQLPWLSWGHRFQLPLKKFSKSLQYYLGLSHMCSSQWPDWELGDFLSCSSVLDVCVYYLGSVPCMHFSKENPRTSWTTLRGCFSKLFPVFVLPGTFCLLRLPFFFSSLNSRSLVTLLCHILPIYRAIGFFFFFFL